jgi:hypothetical protein
VRHHQLLAGGDARGAEVVRLGEVGLADAQLARDAGSVSPRFTV